MFTFCIYVIAAYAGLHLAVGILSLAAVALVLIFGRAERAGER